MSISDFSFAGSGLICISMVCFMTNMPILAMFWRTSSEFGLSLSSAAVRKMDQSLRLTRSA